MYKFTLYTHVWDCTFKSLTNKLPDSEFMPVRNAEWKELWLNRNQILFYEVTEIKDGTKENKNQND